MKKNSDKDLTTLLDPQARGGDIAGQGFRFQNELIVGQIPGWLARDSFVDMIREGLGDAEARFFSPYIGLGREFVEYKNHDLTPSEFWPEIDRFRELEQSYPGAYFQFMLICTGVSTTLEPLVNALSRVREALPFYDDVTSIRDASYSDFLDIVAKHNKTAELAAFIFSKVHIDSSPPKTVAGGLERFRHHLEDYFPIFRDLSARSAREVYDTLVELLGSRSGIPIKRAEIEEAIWHAEPASRPTRNVIHIRTESKAAVNDSQAYLDIRLDLARFSGGNAREYPAPTEWDRGLIQPLERIRDWIDGMGRPRRVEVSGHRRLSSSVAIGAVFNAVAGFTVDLRFNDGELWATSDHARVDTPDYEWVIDEPDGIPAPGLAVALGVIRDPLPSVQQYVDSVGLNIPVLALRGAAALQSAPHVNLAVQKAKEIIVRATDRLGTKRIHLFLAAPAAFALFFGHRLNTTGSVQCYEWMSSGSYSPTCLLTLR